MKRILRRLFIAGLLFSFLLTFASFSPLIAEENVTDETEEAVEETTDKSEDLQKKKDEIAELEDKISQTRQKKQTLASQIAYMNQRIELAQLRIEQTNAEIIVLEDEITDLTEKIGKLDISLDKISQVLLHRVVETYKSDKSDNFLVLLSEEGAGGLVRNSRYLQRAQKHDKMLMMAVEETKQNFDARKELKEEKQVKLKELKVQLEQQNQILAQQKAEKQKLLQITRNNEVRYQQLLTEARKELASLLSFTRSRSTYEGICAGEFSGGETGWYYSQRDNRWCKNLIGHSDMTIGEVGCLITSVAMVNKSKGVSINPPTIAGNSTYFVPPTAYMLLPFPSFIDQRFQAVLKSNIDKELANNNPVIVHLTLSGDGHWVVLVKKDGDGYVINDPWYGPDIKLSKYYSWGLIGRAYALK